MSESLREAENTVVLAGGVAKGAFEAGALEALCGRGIEFSRIVAASSGALNAVVLAAGIRSGQAREAALLLSRLWREEADLLHAFRLSPLDLLRGKGLSSQEALMGLLRRNVKPAASSRPKKSVSVTFVVASLKGVVGRIGESPATTYEQRIDFSGDSFDSEEGLERVIEAAAASAAFPGVYAPMVLRGYGECVDGGAVNNTPIRYALESPQARTVYVIAPFPELIPAPRKLSGLSLLSHLIDVLINERLYRDLRDARKVNELLRGLDRLETSGILSPEAAQGVKAALKWRKAEIREVRPKRSLPGGPFSAFWSPDYRTIYIDEGRRAGEEAVRIHR